MLPWDVCGTDWQPGDQPTDAVLHTFDTVADLTVDPDARCGDLRKRSGTDDSLRMDDTVFNVVRGQLESVWLTVATRIVQAH